MFENGQRHGYDTVIFANGPRYEATAYMQVMDLAPCMRHACCLVHAAVDQDGVIAGVGSVALADFGGPIR